MTELNFSAVPVPDDGSVKPDVSPHDGPACIVCGEPLEYSGRGRKPKYCDEHKKGVTRKNVRSSTAKNEKLAAQATDALMQMNGLASLVFMLSGMPMTATAVNGAEEGLREQVHAALITDPELSAKILSAGTHSAKISLVIAYGMFAAAVVPVGVMEFQQNKEKRALERAESEEVSENGGGTPGA